MNKSLFLSQTECSNCQNKECPIKTAGDRVTSILLSRKVTVCLSSSLYTWCSSTPLQSSLAMNQSVSFTNLANRTCVNRTSNCTHVQQSQQGISQKEWGMLTEKSQANCTAAGTHIEMAISSAMLSRHWHFSPHMYIVFLHTAIGISRWPFLDSHQPRPSH